MTNIFDLGGDREHLSDGISSVVNPGERPICGHGYVILSRQMNRADYIEKSLRNNLLTIITDTNEVIRDCSVSEGAWNFIKFPKSIKTKGSCVIWLCAPNSNKVTILATVTKRDELLHHNIENGFKLLRETENGTSLIEGDGNRGIMNFIVDSEVDDGAKISVRILNSLSQGLFDIYVQGNLNIEVDDTVSLKIKNALKVRFIDEFDNSKFTDISYVLGNGYVMLDEFGNNINVNKDGVKIIVPNGNKIISISNDGVIEPSVLGNELISLLKNLLNEINKITVLTPSGASSPPLNSISFTAIRQSLNLLISKTNFIS